MSVYMHAHMFLTYRQYDCMAIFDSTTKWKDYFV